LKTVPFKCLLVRLDLRTEILRSAHSNLILKCHVHYESFSFSIVDRLFNHYEFHIDTDRMVDKINESVDIVVQLFDDDDDDDSTDDTANDTSMCSFNAKSSHSNQQKETGNKISIVRMPEYRLNARPLYAIQKKDVQIVRQLLKEQNCLLLKAYKSNAMYSCSINEFEEKISTFMTQTNAYSLIEELNETNPNCVKKTLDTIFEQVKTTLDNLLRHQSITAMQYEEMKISRDRVHLDYLFFLPDTCHVSVVIFFPIALFDDL
jgi:hypothetical protein